MWEDAEVISSYTAEQAVEDGFLVEVPPKLAKEAGFRIPVRITRSIHELCTPPKGSLQDYTGRLWDVLWMAWLAIRTHPNTNLVAFVVKIGRKNHKLWAALDGTSGTAIHILQPSEW